MNANGIGAHKAALLAAHRIRWRLGFNDPTFLGWLTVAGYFAAAWLAWRAAGRARAHGDPFDKRFWTMCCALLLCLGINKQLDLHVLLTDAGRYWALTHDLYQGRRLFQKDFIEAIALAGLVALVIGFVVTRKRDATVRLALLGLVVTGVYILIRAASFHHMDQVLRSEIFGMRWDWTVELVGLAVTGFAAWRYRGR